MIIQMDKKEIPLPQVIKIIEQIVNEGQDAYLQNKIEEPKDDKDDYNPEPE